MNYCGLSVYDTANGPGIRVSLFVSGCTLHCKGCFNKESWDFNYGNPFTEKELETILNALENPYIEGLSILGGDPLEPKNYPTILNIVKKCKEKYSNKTIWIWTGRKYEHVKDLEICKYIDTIVDGPFIEKLVVNPADHLPYGSSNQRVIPIAK